MSDRGILSRYTVHGCRCALCREANRVYMAEWKARRQRNMARAGLEGLPPGVEHGSSAYTNYGCRCDVCKGARSAYNAEYRLRTRRVPGLAFDPAGA